jgi:hypothetical protein
VDGADDPGLGQRQHVAVAPEIAGPLGEPVAAVVALPQAVGLDHGAHRTVEHQDAAGEQRLQQGEPFFPAPDLDVRHGTSYKKTPKPKRLRGAF